jgi:hypothetical protein
MTYEQKKAIDAMSYSEMLRKWRFSPVGDSAFQGDDGVYFSQVMTAKRNADPASAVQASKNIGWEK